MTCQSLVVKWGETRSILHPFKKSNPLLLKGQQQQYCVKTPYHQLPTVHKLIHKLLMLYLQLPLNFADSKVLIYHQVVYIYPIYYSSKS